jgi:Mrp family chromosome partitioning ATPase
LRQKKSPTKDASIHRLKPLSTATGRLSERLETLRSRFDFFVRSQALAGAEPQPTHLRLVVERPVDTTLPPWSRQEATSVVLVGPRGADKSFVALEMACAGVAAGRDTVLVHIALERDPAMETLLERATLKGVEAHAIHSSDDLQTLQLLLGEVDLMIVDAPPHNPFSAEEIEAVAAWHNAGLEPLLVMQPTAKPDVLCRIVRNHAQRGVSAVTTARASLAKENSPLSRAAEGAGIPVFIVPPADAARQILPTPPRKGSN